jgi:CRISPR-associated endonuclease/helicase Cas3
MVQFLEAFFGGGTRGVRRLHQLANALIIFDEIQALPIKCVHLFCNAINFLNEQCGSSIVLCTATQPLLKGGEPVKGEGIDLSKGALDLSAKNEIMSNVSELFRELKRVEVCDLCRDKGWTTDEVADLAEESVADNGNCLVVVNLKRQARDLYTVVKSRNKILCFYLTTNMCPAHRKSVFEKIKRYLCEKKPILCISTNLIECGVDISFGSAIRYVAGLDSIAQTAGRCNRHNEMNVGKMYIVNPVDENLNCLEDIKTGSQKAKGVLNIYRDNPEKYHYDPIGPELIAQYYENYFFGQRDMMDYPLSKKEAGRTDSILNLLSLNGWTVKDYKARRSKEYPRNLLPQAFMTAGELFKSINAPTESIIVPFGDRGKDVINRLCSAFEVEKQYDLLKKAQQYAVNVYPGVLKDLKDAQVIYPAQKGTEIYCLRPQYYSTEFGISIEKIVRSEVYDV